MGRIILQTLNTSIATFRDLGGNLSVKYPVLGVRYTPLGKRQPIPDTLMERLMADVYTVTFILIGMLLSLPGLLVGINLLLPNMTQRIEVRLLRKPGRNFFIGVPVTAFVGLWVAIATNVGSGLLSGSAFLLAGLWMGLGTFGAAGLARLLGKRMGRISDPASELTQWVRGAAVFELACLFPLVGWFLFMPLMGIMLVGAAVSSIRAKPPLPITDAIEIGEQVPANRVNN